MERSNERKILNTMMCQNPEYFKCNICGQTFDDKYTLNHHSSSNHLSSTTEAIRLEIQHNHTSNVKQVHQSEYHISANSNAQTFHPDSRKSYQDDATKRHHLKAMQLMYANSQSGMREAKTTLIERESYPSMPYRLTENQDRLYRLTTHHTVPLNSENNNQPSSFSLPLFERFQHSPKEILHHQANPQLHNITMPFIREQGWNLSNFQESSRDFSPYQIQENSPSNYQSQFGNSTTFPTEINSAAGFVTEFNQNAARRHHNTPVNTNKDINVEPHKITPSIDIHHNEQQHNLQIPFGHSKSQIYKEGNQSQNLEIMEVEDLETRPTNLYTMEELHPIDLLSHNQNQNKTLHSSFVHEVEPTTHQQLSTFHDFDNNLMVPLINIGTMNSGKVNQTGAKCFIPLKGNQSLGMPLMKMSFNKSRLEDFHYHSAIQVGPLQTTLASSLTLTTTNSNSSNASHTFKVSTSTVRNNNNQAQ